MQTMFIYDNTGKIYHWTQGNFVIPVGLPYLIVDDYNFEERPIKGIDVTTNPPTPIYGLTKEEAKFQAMTLDEYKACRQNENKEALAIFLKEHPLLWTDGLYYGVTQEDQDEMIADKTAYDFKQSIGQTDWKLEWHSVKSACRQFSVEEFVALLNAIINFVYPYRQLEMNYKEAIYSAATKEEVRKVIISYETEKIEDETTT